MKDRILHYLDKFARGIEDEVANELKKELKLDDSTFRQHAQEIQSAILHQYAQFSISTIDAFFQKVIRSFTRESGLMGDYRLEVEQDEILEEVIDNLIDELGNQKELTQWVVDFARENLENERAWDVRFSLIEFAKEIFRDEFKEIEEDVIRRTSDRDFFRRLRENLWATKTKFLNEAQALGKQALEIFRQSELTLSDISYGRGSGLLTFFETYANANDIRSIGDPSSRIKDHFDAAENWPQKNTPRRRTVIDLANKLIPLKRQLTDFHEKRLAAALSAEVVLQNLYVFGLIADISRKLKEYKAENNVMLLADAPQFLNGVIQDSDTPFIYEKVGSFYRNYLIDEFQDTSAMQWKNFLPLLVNSMDQGYASLVVGDVKQAIYRWRGGDLKLLQEDVEKHIGTERTDVQVLNSNFRSSATIVNFNNIIFEAASNAVSQETKKHIASDAYRDVRQQLFHGDEGFVRIKFIKDQEEFSWQDQAMNLLPSYLEQLQDLGIALKDVAILVRKNDEGQQIVTKLLFYKNSERAKPGYKYDVVSNESLRIDGASSVNLLLGAMRYLLNPDDVISRAQLGYEFARQQEPTRPLTDVFAVANQIFFESNLPPAFAREKSSLKKLPLFELTETLIEIFKLGDQKGELAYLQAFQNLVLEFYSREKNDLGAFLEWWDLNKHKKSIQVSGEVDAVQILTIHKAKGLQFKYVIIPFCVWNLDHDPFRSPTLWVSSQEPPFNDAGFLPVRYSKSLERTCFKNFYLEERTRSYLDNLNLLYVALTRAEKGMIVLAPDRSKAENVKSSADLLYFGILNTILIENWNQSTLEYSAGTRAASGDLPPDKSEAINLNSYPAFHWREKLVIRQTAKGYFDPAQSEKREKMNFGIHLHTILSRIKYSQDLLPAVEQMLLEGFITADEKQPLVNEIEELFKLPQVSRWFQKDWEIRTEIPILLPDGNENRIDRLMIKDKKAVVVDFKTGSPQKADQAQVLVYMDILRKMNFLEVEGYLLYIKTKQVASVSREKVKVSKRKDENQISLEF